MATSARAKAMCASGFTLLLLCLPLVDLRPNAKGRGVPPSWDRGPDLVGTLWTNCFSDRLGQSGTKVPDANVTPSS
jgi:hypothetical protein